MEGDMDSKKKTRDAFDVDADVEADRDTQAPDSKKSNDDGEDGNKQEPEKKRHKKEDSAEVTTSASASAPANASGTIKAASKKDNDSSSSSSGDEGEEEDYDEAIMMMDPTSDGPANSRRAAEVGAGAKGEREREDHGTRECTGKLSSAQLMRREKRLAMNRASARARRKRKKILLDSLANQVPELTKNIQDQEGIIRALRARNEQLEAAVRQAQDLITALMPPGSQASATSQQSQQLLQQQPQLQLQLLQQQLQSQHQQQQQPPQTMASVASSNSAISAPQQDALRAFLEAATPLLNTKSNSSMLLSGAAPSSITANTTDLQAQLKNLMASNQQQQLLQLLQQQQQQQQQGPSPSVSAIANLLQQQQQQSSPASLNLHALLQGQQQQHIGISTAPLGLQLNNPTNSSTCIVGATTANTKNNNPLAALLAQANLPTSQLQNLLSLQQQSQQQSSQNAGMGNRGGLS